MPVLSIISGPRLGSTLRFETTAVLGRGAGADLDLNDRAASRHHARIERDGRRFFLSDEGSGNGTFLNGSRVEGRRPLAHRDVVRLGVSRVEFLVDDTGMVETSGSSVSLFEEFESLTRSDTSEAPAIEIARRVPTSAMPTESDPGDKVNPLQQHLALVRELSAITTETLDLHVVLSRALEVLFDSFPTVDRGFFVRYAEGSREGEGDFIPAVARTRDGESSEIPASLTILRAAVESGELLLCSDTHDDKRYEDAVSLHAINLRSVVCVPLLIGERVYGVLQLDSTTSPWSVSDDDLAALSSAGAAIAHAMANAELHQRLTEQVVERHDLELARSIQQRFLPTAPPRLLGWEFSATYQPAQAVGGDLYSFVDLSAGQIGIALGDVSGKGIAAALLMARVMSDLRYLSARSDDPSETLALLNRELVISGGDGLFVTMLYMVLDPVTGDLEVANGGHMDPIARRRDGSVARLETERGPALGIDDMASFPSSKSKLNPGDSLLLYSDGLTEAAGHQSGERYGLGRLCRALISSETGANQIAESVLSSVAQFAADDRPQDDLTTVVITRRP